MYTTTLPKHQCPYMIMVITPTIDAELVTEKCCTNRPGKYGWCSDHAYILNFLVAGYVLDWPAVTINQSRHLDAGVVNWENTALRLHTAMPRLKRFDLVYTNLYELHMTMIWPLVRANEVAECQYRKLRAEIIEHTHGAA